MSILIDNKIAEFRRDYFDGREINYWEKIQLYFLTGIFLWRGALRIVNGYYRLRNCKTGKMVRVRGPLRVEGIGKIRVGDNCSIWSHIGKTQLYSGPGAELSIGDNSFINSACIISASFKILIGKNVQIGNQVIMMDADFHGVDNREKLKRPNAIFIEDNVWIATRSMVLKGVTIGKGSTVAAGSVVTKNVPPHSLVAGVPAKVIRQLKPELN